MEDKHRKLRRKLYAIIAFGVGWVCIGISIIVFSVTGGESFFFTVFAVAVFSSGLYWLFRIMRPIRLDLRELPVEVEGLLVDKRRVDDREGGSSYYLRIDTLESEVECGRNEWDMVTKGDRVRMTYHRHSKWVESITMREKAG